MDFAYLVPAAIGQLDLLANIVPVDEAVASGSLTEEQIAKLALIADVRTYATEVMGLNVDGNYTSFYDAGEDPVAINVSASAKDAFAPKIWTFPLVGQVPYLGYFDLSAAAAKRDELTREGLDVFTYEIDAYSGIGFFPNPILSPMLRRSDIALADTVLHELLHSTIWRANDTPFNESMATFFGRHGAVNYFRDRFPDQPDLVAAANNAFQDGDRFNEFAFDLYTELDAYYRSNVSRSAKIIGREDIFEAARRRFASEVHQTLNFPANYDWVQDLPSNNAFMLGVRRYNLELDVFEQVFAATGDDWPASVNVFWQAASADDAYGFLRNWLSIRGLRDSPASSIEAANLAKPEIRTPSEWSTTGAPIARRGVCQCHLATTIIRPE